ncbi:hypothetical protein MMC14_000759 [Varicellaria rhodocarpa]|nr:hypothetical protein [Varicellaria rhodocarpa]
MDHLWPQFVETNPADGSTFPKDPTLLFFSGNVGGEDGGGVTQEVVDKSLSHLVRCPMSAFTTETVGTAWRNVPVTYIFTSQDYSVPRVYQNLMVERVRRDGVILRTEGYEASHSIFITKREEMV